MEARCRPASGRDWAGWLSITYYGSIKKKLNTLYPDGAMAVLYLSVFYKISESTGLYRETVSCCGQLNATEEQHKF